MTAHLRLLGTFGLTDTDGSQVSIASSRAQSLFAYLALEGDAPHSRARISFLLWPDASEAQARNSLRQLLHQVRQAWPGADRYLVTDASTLTLNPGARLDVDVAAYEAAVARAVATDARTSGQEARAAFERAAELYQGDLLPGSYDDWIVPRRDRLIATHQRTLDRLIGLLESQGDYRAAIEYGQRRLQLDVVDERIYRWLMRLHALNQDRAGALRVYQACAAALEEELGVEPDAETRRLHEQIIRREPAPTGDAATPTAARSMLVTGAGPERLPLVGRQPEWAIATGAWERSEGGMAGLLVIGGEAGIGKSRLAAELVTWSSGRGAQTSATRAWAAEGRLSYGPVAEWLRSPALASGLPRLDAASLCEISRLLPELLTQRPDLPRPSARIEDWQRQAFFGALVNAFVVVDRPQLLVLDDLQWCDADTLEWLHFLLRAGRGSPLLVVGTVRSDEVDAAHPATRLLAGLRKEGRLTEIALGPLEPAETSTLAAQVAGRSLTPAQASDLQRETEGNPLFVVETVRAGLVQPVRVRTPVDTVDDGVAAVAGVTARRRAIAPKVQQVIAARLGQLTPTAKDLASVGATVGRAFTLDVVHGASGLAEGEVVEGLDELLRRAVIREQGGGVYDFAHDKIREVAYATMTDASRRLLHRRVAESLERVHAPVLDAVAAQIAGHYAHAGQADRASAYYRRAAEVEQRIGANLEAIALLTRGLTLLETLPPSADRDARELDLRTVLGVSLVATRGYGSAEASAVYLRCRQLCQVLGRPPSPPVMRAMAMISLAQAQIDECHALGDHLLSIAERDDDPVLRAEAYFVIGVSLVLNGATRPARAALEASLASYDRSRSPIHIGLYSQDPGVVCSIRLALLLWIMGEPAESARRRDESVELATSLAHPFTLGYSRTWDAIIECHRGNAAGARAAAEAAVALGRDHRMPFWLSIATAIRGWAIAEEGEVEAGIEEIRRGMADFATTGTSFLRPYLLGLLAEQYGRSGNLERGHTLIAEALAASDRMGGRWCDPELHRRNGDMHAAAGDDAAAEAA